MRGTQARLLTERLPDLAIEAERHALHGWFAKKPFEGFVLEIGFGGGEHLVSCAKTAPTIGFIGCEPFVNGIAKILSVIDTENLTNIRIFPDDARKLLDVLPPQSFESVFLLYPDPWPKKRHHKRRFVQPDTLQAVFQALVTNGQFMVASDSADYIDWTLGEIYAHGGFNWEAKKVDDWLKPPQNWHGTRYEAKARAAGRASTYLRFTRRAKKTPQSL